MIVFSDMDGTLLTSDKQMSDATWAMLDELAHRGIEFVPCTGRPLSGIFEPILAHPAVHYAVCANGASVWQLDEDAPTDTSRATRILSRPLDRAIAHRVHSIAAGHDVLGAHQPLLVGGGHAPFDHDGFVLMAYGLE